MQISKLNYKIIFLLIAIFPISIILGSFAINFVLFIFFLIFLNNFHFFFDDIKNKIDLKLFYLFYIYLIFNALISDNIGSSLERAFFYFRYIILFQLIIFYLKIHENKNLSKIILVWLFIILIFCFDLIFQAYFGYNITGYSLEAYGRNSSFFYDELKAGSLIVGLCYLGVAIFYLIYKKKNISLILLLLLTVACILTGERSNSIKSIILLISISFIILKNDKKFLISSYIIFAITIASLSQFNKNVIDRLISSSHYSDVSKDNYLEKYLSTQWGSHAVVSYLIFKDNPVFGVGNKNFRIKCSEYEEILQRKYKLERGCSTHPHQIYYEMISEHGLFGTSIFLILFFYLIVQRIRSSKLNIVNYTALFFILINFLPLLPSGSFFSTNNSFIFWINLSFYIYNFKIKQ